ncbi:3-hydroxy-9,10-secoandrosta-1,3,5(10)-triene-9,17-dione monooxygenase reductase subunit [Actinomadura sp. NTSP31]|uniref:3-hydroxy-9,10-secoandrosta-1,3,5(10)-triene-9, 17-dione monooxygenase reductase subunit n=1 Tax=Actinomadura sp. NTSP31 TaxID=1735447 RepID=UPI0035BF54E9
MSTPVDAQTFRNVLGHFCTGVTVVAGLDRGEPVGLACQSFTSLSLDPPLVLFCPGRTSTSWPRIRNGGRFSVNVLADDQRDVCAAFGATSAPKFSVVGWRRTAAGAVVLDGVLTWLDCSIEAVHDGGDHDIVVGRVRELGVERDHRPLLFYRGRHDLDEPFLSEHQ